MRVAHGCGNSRFKRRRVAAKARAKRFDARIAEIDRQFRLHGRDLTAKPIGRGRHRELLAAARAANPAIRTVRGAKKLDQRLTREAKAGAR